MRLSIPSGQPGLISEFAEKSGIEVNQMYGRKFGRVSMGRLIGPDGNELRTGLTVEIGEVWYTPRSQRANVKLKALTGSPAARQTSTYRNGPYVCWYAVRDFLTEFYALCPDATVRTVLETYRGSDDFKEKFTETYYSTMFCRGDSGMTFGELCHNLGWHDQHDRNR